MTALQRWSYDDELRRRLAAKGIDPTKASRGEIVQAIREMNAELALLRTRRKKQLS